MSKKAKPCSKCGQRPKVLPRHFCAWCLLARGNADEQAAAARERLALVPESARLSRAAKVIKEDTPRGLAFCAGCQTFCPDWYFGAKATQCRGCVSGKRHAARVEKVYGLSRTEYDELLGRQDGRCAICQRRPSGKRRLAVDHDHKSGKVRGLLCSGERGCNHGILGSAHDDAELLRRAYEYLLAPPAQETEPESQPEVEPEPAAFTKPSETAPKKAEAEPVGECSREHYLPVGSEPVPGKKGVWRLWVAIDDPDGSPPF